MKTFLHIAFIISIILLMVILLIPAIIIYMFTGYNVITELHFEAGKLERKYFN
jgi:phosphoglycerol transferase MdoB-like AlkP superfamily enzyme